jgi:hypothetical protein
MKFKQISINLDRFTYTINEDGIRLLKKGIVASSDTFVDFEDIGSKIIAEKSRKLLWLLIAIIFFILAITVFVKRLQGGPVGHGAEIFHISLSLLFFSIYFITKKNLLFLVKSDNTNGIEFIYTNKYKQQVDDFIKLLLQKRDTYLLETYSSIDDMLPYQQQYNNLVWLYELKIINKELLQSKIAALDKIEELNQNKKHTKILGFGNRQIDDETNYIE